MKVIFVGVFLIICCLHIGQIRADSILLYKLANFGGKPYEQNIDKTDCINLDESINDTTWSIDTKGHCVRLYEHKNCQGKKKTISPSTHYHENLYFLGEFQQKASSLIRC